MTLLQIYIVVHGLSAIGLVMLLGYVIAMNDEEFGVDALRDILLVFAIMIMVAPLAFPFYLAYVVTSIYRLKKES